jgi:hypothetical protein
MAKKVACVDWSAAKGDEPLVAYCWRGEADLHEAHFVGSH